MAKICALLNPPAVRGGRGAAGGGGGVVPPVEAVAGG